MRNFAVAGLAVCVFSGCATTTNYTPPSRMSVTNSTKVERPFDSVWDQLVRELSGDFFVINNIDKNSRIINISFSSNRPSDYVDCGLTSRSSNSMLVNGVTQYNTADSVGYQTASPVGQVLNVNRNTKLEGRSNIYVAPNGSGTDVVVNTKYVLNIRTAVTALDGRSVGQGSRTIDFSTKSPSSPAANEPGCATKGAIEAKILSFVSASR
jgi:hypothetical protein